MQELCSQRGEGAYFQRGLLSEGYYGILLLSLYSYHQLQEGVKVRNCSTIRGKVLVLDPMQDHMQNLGLDQVLDLITVGDSLNYNNYYKLMCKV